MNKKDITAPFIIAGLSILFIIICTAIFFTKGKSEKWIARKMKIGGLLLGLNAVINTGCASQVKCYAPVPSNMISVENSIGGTLRINISENSVIKGSIKGYTHIFSYMITDSTFANVLIQENLVAEDGIFDSFNENFVISVPQSLSTGNYYLLFFTLPKEEQSKINYFNRYKLYLKN